MTSEWLANKRRKAKERRLKRLEKKQKKRAQTPKKPSLPQTKATKLTGQFSRSQFRPPGDGQQRPEDSKVLKLDRFDAMSWRPPDAQETTNSGQH